MAEMDVRARHQAKGDREIWTGADSPSDSRELAEVQAHPMDREPARKELRKLLEWYYYEKDKQSTNRLQMAMDADFYDNLQWDPEDAATVSDRGQMPLVYNEVAPMCDWLIGTERRTRVDWKVLPRTEDDVQLADTKTKVMKYVSDINRVVFARSRAFGDAVKAGLGWVDDGVRDDPTKDILYSKYEDWRNVLHDSSSYELDLEDARYVFRWRWVDEDVACCMFPGRRNAILRAVEDAQHSASSDWEEDTWATADELLNGIRSSGTLRASGTGPMVDAKRRRVKLIECQYRNPSVAKIIAEGPFKGMFLNQGDGALMRALEQSRYSGSIVDKMVMRVHMAVFTEADMIDMGPSPFRHNRFTLTPIWCYRRGRDRLPYGAIRRVRDVQMDINKRASKALFLLNTNQVIAEEGATEDWNTLRDEADRPDGLIVVKAGKKVEIRRDTDAATGQVQMMALGAQTIQKSAGVADENLGRQTNAVSGEAIKARQTQGSVVTTEPFDNLRLATQEQGQKQLSLTEQFYTEEKVIRLTGGKKIEWVRINVPEEQADGSVRFINDITQSAADFVVSEADYAGTMRQVMFESLNQIVGRLPPEVGLRLLTIAYEHSDLPNKDQVADQIRKLTGDRDENKPMSPEEQQAAEKQAAQQAELLEFQRAQAVTALEEQRAKVRELNAKAAKLEAEAGAAGATGGDGMALQVQQQASEEIDHLSEQLRKAQSDLANQTLRIRADKDTALEVARIDAEAKRQVAEIQAASNERIKEIEARLNALMAAIEAKDGDTKPEGSKA